MLSLLRLNLRALVATVGLFFALSFSAFAETVSSGTFVGATGHTTSGGVSVEVNGDTREVVLAADFYLDGAPDPKVGFGTNGEYASHAQLAHLDKNTGEQRYTIPADLDISGFNEIYIWCEKFSVPLGVAKIK